MDMKIKKSTLWRLAALIYIPALAYLCGALFAHGLMAAFN